MFGKWWRILIFKITKIFLWSTEMQMHLGQGQSSHRSCYIKVGVLKIFLIFTENYLCWTLFFINTSVFLWIFRNFKNNYIRPLLTRYTNSICSLFLEKCILPKPNSPSFRFSLFSVRGLDEVLKRAFLDFLHYGYALLISLIHSFISN